MTVTSIRSVSATPPLSTGTQDYTVSGFGTPKAVMVILSRATGDHAAICFGLSDGTRTRYSSIRCRDAAATTNTRRVGDDDGVICELIDQASDSLEASATFDSWITDGVRLNWAVAAPSSDYSITVVLFTGTSLQVYVDNFLSSNTVGATTDITTVGFEPDVLICVSHRLGNTGVVNSTATLSLGVAWNDGGADPPPQYSVNWLSVTNDAISTKASMHFRDDGVVAMFSTDGVTTPGVGRVQDFDANGFTVETLLSGANGRPSSQYLALKFGNPVSAMVGTHATPTSTGSDSFTTNFRPQFGLFLLHKAAAVNTQQQDADGSMVGMGLIVEDVASSFSVWDQDNVATSNCGTVVAASLVIPSNTGTNSYQVDVDQTTDVGWDVSFNTVAGTSHTIPFLAVQLEFEASGSGSYPLNTGSGTGALVFQGTAAGTLPLSTAAGTGSLVFSGSGAGTFSSPVGSGTGSLVFQAVGTGTLPNGTLAGTAQLIFQASGAGSLSGPLLSATGSLVFEATAAGIIAQPVISGSSLLTFESTGIGIVQVPSISGSAQLVFQASGQAQIALLTGSGSGTVSIVGSGAGVVQNATISGTGMVPPPETIECTHNLSGSYQVLALLSGSHSLVSGLSAGYDGGADLKGSIC